MSDKKLPETDVDIRSIRTFEDDIAQAVKTQHESAISISVKESEKKEKESRQIIKPTKSVFGTILVFLSIFFIMGGIVILGYFWWQSRPVIIERVIIDTLVIADEDVSQNIKGMSKEEFIVFVQSKQQDTKDVGTITHLKLKDGDKEETIDGETFLRLLGARPPSALLRSMSGDSMFGLIQLPEYSVPFWIVEIDSFENALGGILNWEMLLQEDLGPVFSTKEPVLDPVFQDVISRNKDIRVLYNDQGEELLVHAFLDKSTLLITANEEAFRELLPLFISSKQIR